MTYSSADVLAHPGIQLTKGGLVLIGVLRGGDYSDGLRGCGVQIAHGLAKAGFGDTLLEAALTLPRPALSTFLSGWREDLRTELRTNAKGCLPRKCAALSKTVPEDFPNIDIVLAYTNPVTSEAKGAGHRNVTVDWDKEPDLGRIAGLCEMYFEWGVKQIIIKRFRTVLWPAAVLRILRRAAILKDRKAVRAVGSSRLPPETPRKNGKERRAPPGTPSSMIAKHFSGMALNSPERRGVDRGSDADSEGEDEEDPLIVKIHSSRQHASTDRILEYRLEIAPAQLVRLCEAGIKGLRTALPPDLSDEDEDEDDDDDEGGGKKKGKKGKRPPPDPDSHLRLWLPACMVAMVEPEMVDEFEGVQKWKAEKKAAKGKKAAAPSKATAANKTKAKGPAVAVVPEEEEESSGEDSEPPPPPKSKTTKAKTGADNPANKGGPNKPSAIGGSKIDEFFGAKKTTSKVAGGKLAKAVAKSSTNKVPALFKDLSSGSDEEPHAFKRPSPASQKTSSATHPSMSTTSSSSRILSFLDSQPQHRHTSPSKASVSPSKSRTPQPFPMDFNAYPLNKPSESLPSDIDEDLFTPGAGSSSQSPSRAHTRTRSAVSSSSSDTRPSKSTAVHKSPRRSEKHTSPRNSPRKDRERRVQRTPRKEEEEESSESDSDPVRRPPSPSPLKGQRRLPTALGARAYIPMNAWRDGEEDSDRAPSSSTRPEKLMPQPAPSRGPARPTVARKPKIPAPLPADMTIISISSGSEPDDDLPPPKPAKKATPLELARARLGKVSTGNKPPRRACDLDDVIDLT